MAPQSLSRESTSPAERVEGRFDPFRVLTAEERRDQLDGYRDFLRERDGEMDFERRTLSNREAYFKELEARPVHWRGDVDIDAFYQHFYAVGKPPLDARTTWLLAVAISNEGESYGVEGEVEMWGKRGLHEVDPIVLYDLLEEQYHSRILVEACRTAGVGNVRLKTPRFLHRQMIHMMHHFPDQLRYIPIICGETLGCIVFRHLLETSAVFPEQPEVEERLHSLLSEITLDEVGHVVYCRAHMRPRSLRIAKRLVHRIVGVLMREVPQLSALGLDRGEIDRRLQSGVDIPRAFAAWLPSDVR